MESPGEVFSNVFPLRDEEIVFWVTWRPEHPNLSSANASSTNPIFTYFMNLIRPENPCSWCRVKNGRSFAIELWMFSWANHFPDAIDGLHVVEKGKIILSECRTGSVAKQPHLMLFGAIDEQIRRSLHRRGYNRLGELYIRNRNTFSASDYNYSVENSSAALSWKLLLHSDRLAIQLNIFRVNIRPLQIKDIQKASNELQVLVAPYKLSGTIQKQNVHTTEEVGKQWGCPGENIFYSARSPKEKSFPVLIQNQIYQFPLSMLFLPTIGKKEGSMMAEGTMSRMSEFGATCALPDTLMSRNFIKSIIHLYSNGTVESKSGGEGAGAVPLKSPKLTSQVNSPASFSDENTTTKSTTNSPMPFSFSSPSPSTTKISTPNALPPVPSPSHQAIPSPHTISQVKTPPSTSSVIRVAQTEDLSVGAPGEIDFNAWFEAIEAKEEPVAVVVEEEGKSAPAQSSVPTLSTSVLDDIYSCDTDTNAEAMEEALQHIRGGGSIRTFVSKDSPLSPPSSDLPPKGLTVSIPFDEIASMLLDSSEQVIDFNKRKSAPILVSPGEHTPTPPAYLCPIQFKALTINIPPFSLSSTFMNSKKDKTKQSCLFTKEASNISTTINQTSFHTLTSIHEHSHRKISGASARESSGKRQTAPTLLHPTQLPCMSKMMIKKINMIKLHMMEEGKEEGNSESLCILLSDVFPQPALSYHHTLSYSTTLPRSFHFGLSVKGMESLYEDLVVQFAFSPLDCLEIGNASRSVYDIILNHLCTSDRMNHRSTYESLCRSLMETVEPASAALLAFRNPLVHSSYPNARNLDYKTLLFMKEILSEVCGEVSGPFPCHDITTPLTPATTSNETSFHIERFNTPTILVGHKRNSLEVDPKKCVKYWEKGGLLPFAARKPFSYITLCPFSTTSGLSKEMMSGSVVKFMKELSIMYEICNLGTHRPLHGVLSHLALIPLSMDHCIQQDPYKRMEEQLQRISNVSEKLRKDLQNHHFYPNSCLVIYFLNPFSFELSEMEFMKCFIPLQKAFAERTNVVFQMIPLSHVLSHPEGNKLEYLKEVCFSIFHRCRRISYKAAADPSHLAYKLYEPLFILSPSSVPSVNFHVTYMRSPTQKHLVTVLTDSRGEFLEYSVFHVGHGDIQNDPNLVWKACTSVLHHLPSSVKFENLFVAKFGHMGSAEWNAWIELKKTCSSPPRCQLMHVLHMEFSSNPQLYNVKKEENRVIPLGGQACKAIAIYYPDGYSQQFSLQGKTESPIISSSCILHMEEKMEQRNVQISLCISDSLPESNVIRTLTTDIYNLSWLNIRTNGERSSILPHHVALCARTAFILPYM